MALWERWARGRMPIGPLGLPRGFAKLVVLDALKDGPAHGYEVAKRIAEEHAGLYRPSSGLIYPTLSLLGDLGYVTAASKEGKTVYEITIEGKEYLKDHRDDLDNLTKMRSERWPKSKVAGAMLQIKDLAQTVMDPRIMSSEEKAREAAKILEDARKRVERLYR